MLCAGLTVVTANIEFVDYRITCMPKKIKANMQLYFMQM